MTYAYRSVELIGMSDQPPNRNTISVVKHIRAWIALRTNDCINYYAYDIYYAGPIICPHSFTVFTVSGNAPFRLLIISRVAWL